jgi:hypothetical protein
MTGDQERTSDERGVVPSRVDRWAWARLESPALTATFWGAAAIFALAFWLTPFPPCIDYPQHLAIGAIIRRLMIPGAPEHADYVFTPITYNGLFHVAVAVLSLVFSPEVSGKILLSLIPLGTGGSALAVLRVARRPLWYAFFLLPFSYSYIIGWGFINYALATPLGFFVIAWWMRWRDGERRLLPWIIVASLAIAYAHVLAMLCLSISIGVATLAWRLPREVGIARWLRGLVVAPWPVLPAVGYSVVVFLFHRAAPHIYWEPQKDGIDAQTWSKLWNLSAYSVNNLSSQLDRTLFVIALALVLALWITALFVPPRRDAEEPATAGALEPAAASPLPPSSRRRELVALAAVWFVLYLVTPRVLMSTWWIFERLPIWWFLFVVAITPRLPPSVVRWIQVGAAGVGVASSLVTAQAFHAIPDARDADAILDDIPEGSRVVALMYSVSASPAVWREMWVHQLAYYLARRSGHIAFDFTRYASIPVRPRDATKPPLFPSSLEWNPSRYNPHAPYAKAYPMVLVRTPDDAPDEDPRELAFGYEALDVKVLSHRGRFWLLDASALHTD